MRVWCIGPFAVAVGSEVLAVDPEWPIPNGSARVALAA